MAGAIKKCRVCGKDYEACRSAKRVDGIYRWKDVACSPECGQVYLARILESRKPAVEEKIVTASTEEETIEISKPKQVKKKVATKAAENE